MSTLIIPLNRDEVRIAEHAASRLSLNIEMLSNVGEPYQDEAGNTYNPPHFTRWVKIIVDSTQLEAFWSNTIFM